MAKREPDPEPLEDEQLEPELAPVGERLRAAREGRGLSLEDVAAQTRIPRRHLESIEKAEWDNLPAPTYTIGFAKSYASVVGLERSEIGDQLREEMGGQRFASMAADVFEPADPRRTMPKGLVIGAIAALVLLIAVMSWLNKRSLQQPDETAAATTSPASDTAPAAKAPVKAPATVRNPSTAGPVVLSASAPVWLQVSEKGGRTLYSGTLQAGQSYTVPTSAAAPVLKTGKPEALTIKVGAAQAPPVGRPATTVSNVSLRGTDLMNSPGSASAAGSQAGQGTVGAPSPGPSGQTSSATPATANGQ